MSAWDSLDAIKCQRHWEGLTSRSQDVALEMRWTSCRDDWLHHDTCLKEAHLHFSDASWIDSGKVRNVGLMNFPWKLLKSFLLLVKSKWGEGLCSLEHLTQFSWPHQERGVHLTARVLSLLSFVLSSSCWISLTMGPLVCGTGPDQC